MIKDGQNIFRLFKTSFVYIVATVISRFITFALLPVFTNFLTAEEFGIFSLIIAFISFVAVLVPVGTDSALLNYYIKFPEQKKSYFSVAYFMTLFNLLLFSLLFFLLRKFIMRFVIPDENFFTVFLVLLLVVIEVLNIFPRLIFRAENKAILFFLVSVIHSIFMFTLCYLFVAKSNMGVRGIILGFLLSDVTVFIFTLPSVFKNIHFRIPIEVVKKIITFSFPFAVSAVFGMLLEVSDRFILKFLSDLKAVGLYSAGYRVGSLMNILVIGFNLAWYPYFLNIINKEDAKRRLSNTVTIVITVFLYLWFLIYLWIADFLKIRVFGVYLMGGDYWPAISIIPVIALGYIFLLFYNLQIPGIFQLEKTKYVPIAYGVATTINIILNIILIPILGYSGAAISTCISYFVLSFVIYIVNNKIYPMQYQWSKITLNVFFIGLMILFVSFYKSITIKVLITVFVSVLHCFYISRVLSIKRQN